MAALELEAKLAILDQAMKRLEGELQQDEHWCALHHPMPDADGEAALARKLRLLQALEANPVYRAWRDMQGVAALVRTQSPPAAAPVAVMPADAPPAALEPAEATPPRDAADAFAAHYELPGDMADLVRTELEGAGQDRRAAAGPEQPDRRARLSGLSQRIAEATGDMRAERSPIENRRPEDLGSEATHSVPLAAEDLEFLISPAKVAARKADAPSQKTPFLQRLAAEGQIPRPLRTDGDEEAEVTVVRRPRHRPASTGSTRAPVEEQDAGTGPVARIPKPLGS